MSSLNNKVLNKLQELEFNIFDHYYTDEKELEYVFLIENMVLFLHQKSKILSVSFHAVIKAEDAASNILSLKEIDEIDSIEILDSFIYDNEGTMIYGQEAYELIEKRMKDEAIQGFVKEQTEKIMLNNVECYSC